MLGAMPHSQSIAIKEPGTRRMRKGRKKIRWATTIKELQSGFELSQSCRMKKDLC